MAKVNQILVINSGSSSLKLSLFEYKEKAFFRLADAEIKEIDGRQSILSLAFPRNHEETNIGRILTVKEGLRLIFEALESKCEFSFNSLLGIGHRFVHGGTRYHSSIRLDDTIVSDLAKLSSLAPLHNDACLAGIRACIAHDQNVPQVAVFDTSFHHRMPPVAAYYAIPWDMCVKYGIKRYGFHGIAHNFNWNVYEKQYGRDSKIISIHLGNGCSIAAIAKGVSVDTSMGFSPSEGLVMSTRAGDVDAAVVEYLCDHKKIQPKEVLDLLNRKSGLLGISGVSSDMKAVLAAYHENEQAKLAVDMFCYRIVKYIGAYMAALGGVKAILFSGGIGENSPDIRERVMSQMGWNGMILDEEANRHAKGASPGNIKKISNATSSCGIYVVATDEDLFIAQEVARTL